MKIANSLGFDGVIPEKKIHKTCKMRKKANDFGQVHPRGLEAVGLGVGGAKTQVARKSSVLIEGENKKICNNRIF